MCKTTPAKVALELWRDVAFELLMSPEVTLMLVDAKASFTLMMTVIITCTAFVGGPF